MADEEVTDSVHTAKARKMVELWASTVDALLQEFLEKGQAEDRLGTAIVSVRLAQVGLMMQWYFQECGETLLSGKTELAAATQAVRHMQQTVKRSLQQIGVIPSELASDDPAPTQPAPALTGKGDPSLN
jgi:hypothetical protein